MPPQSSNAVAAFARVVLRVTGLVVVVVIGFYVPPTAMAIWRQVQDWLKSLQYSVSLLYQLGRTCNLAGLSIYYQSSRRKMF